MNDSLGYRSLCVIKQDDRYAASGVILKYAVR